MADADLLLSLVAVICLSLTVVVDGATCHYKATNYGYPYRSYTFYRYCQSGCCSYGCCTSQFRTSIGVIISCVVGAIAFVALVISAICCCIRRRGRRGQVIRSGQPGFNPAAPGVAVIQHSNTHTSAPASTQPQYNYGMQPMGGTPGNAAFKPYAEPPPAYPGYSNAAYSTSDNPGTTPTYPPSNGGDSNPAGNNAYGTLGLANAGYSQPPPPGFNP